jgi:hypothetical protein
MIDALIKRVSVTKNVMKCMRIGGKSCNCSCFEIDQEMDRRTEVKQYTPFPLRGAGV